MGNTGRDSIQGTGNLVVIILKYDHNKETAPFQTLRHLQFYRGRSIDGGLLFFSGRCRPQPCAGRCTRTHGGGSTLTCLTYTPQPARGPGGPRASWGSLGAFSDYYFEIDSPLCISPQMAYVHKEKTVVMGNTL